MSEARAYLDCNASERLRPAAREAVRAALEHDGNPSSVHAEGRRARGFVEEAREAVARLVGAKPSEVVFTSGASEANTTVMSAGWQRIVCSGIEHESVLAPARARCANVRVVSADEHGIADVGAMAGVLLADGVAAGRTLIALQMANNETGVLQPIAETAAFARAHGAIVHTDAVQAAGRTAIDFAALGVDAMAVSSHKIGGPKGVGALIVRDGLTLAPLIAGGGQERGRRAGTENVAALAGFGAAARAAAAELETVSRLAALRDRLEREVRRLTPAVRIIGAGAPRLVNTTCLASPGDLAETLVIKLDLAGIAVSAGAACSSGKVGRSHVLDAMGLAPDLSRGAIRVSFGHASSDRDVDAFLHVWAALAAARSPEGAGRETNEMITRRPAAA